MALVVATLRAADQRLEAEPRVFANPVVVGLVEEATPERSEAMHLEEVATLIARGWSNRQIAAALVSGEPTVEMHVSHTPADLGFESRSQLTDRRRCRRAGRSRPPASDET